MRAWLKKNPGVVDKLAPVPGRRPTPKGKDAGKPRRTIGYFPWDEDIATTYLWKNVLEKRGYKPNIKQIDVGSDVHRADHRASSTSSSTAGCRTPRNSTGTSTRRIWSTSGAWYDQTSLEIAVPVRTSRTSSPSADLKGKATTFERQDHRHRAGHRRDEAPQGQGRCRRTAWTRSTRSLDGSTPAMLAELERAYAKKEPVAVVLWSPHWAYSKYKLTKLADPKRHLGRQQPASTHSATRASRRSSRSSTAG